MSSEYCEWFLVHVKTLVKVPIKATNFQVGRNIKADLCLRKNSVSRNHASFCLTPDKKLFLRDCGSSNGTFINKRKLESKRLTELKHGDEVGFGYCLTVPPEDIDDPISSIYKVIFDSNDVIEIDDDEVEDHDVSKESPLNSTTKVKSEIHDSVSPNVVQDISQEPSNAVNLNKDAQVTQVKQEQVKTTQEYLAVCENDCVVISDDDDNDFACSQIVQLDIEIKKEQETSIDEEVMSRIKQELHDLDFDNDNILNKVPIDLDDNFQDSEDLLQHLLAEDCNPKIDTGTNGKEHASTDEERNSETIPEPIEANKSNGVDTNGRNYLDDLIFKKPVYVKPPIVKAHIIKPKTTAKPKPESEPKRDKQKATVQRKSTPLKRTKPMESESTSQKKLKPGSNFVQSTYDKKSIENEFKKRKTNVDVVVPKDKQLIEERKRKLKEVCATNKISEEVPKHRVVPKVKCSEGRGQFLLESNPGPSTSRASTRNTARNSNGPSTSKSSNAKTTPNSLKKIPTATPKTFTVVTTSPLPSNYFTEGLNTGIYRGVIDPKSKLKDAIKRLDVEDRVAKIVQWKMAWLAEQRNRTTAPPVDEHQPVEMPRLFESFSDYYNILGPLVMLELWQYVFDSLYKKQTRDAFRVFVSHSRNTDKYLTLDCECYFAEPDAMINNLPRANDFALIELKLKTEGKSETYLTRGLCLITTCFSEKMKNDSQINLEVAALIRGTCPHTKVKFKLVTKSWPDKILSHNVIILKIISNISGYLKRFKTIKCVDLSSLKNVILKPTIKDFQLNCSKQKLVINNVLNQQQKTIVLEACEVCSRNEPGIYLIKGPPGTGKSTVILSVILEMLLKNNQPIQILLTAPSNAAVDHLVLKLIEIRNKMSEQERKNIKLIRIGPEQSISPLVQKYRLRFLANSNMIRKFYGTKEYQEAKVAHQTLDEEKFLRKQLGITYSRQLQETEDWLLQCSNIICTTLNSSLYNNLVNAIYRGQLNFTCCIIDEATQCSEDESLLPLQLAIDKFVLVGDPQQLPATVINKEADKFGLGKSLFTRISENFENCKSSPIRTLVQQYRMHPEICSFPNRMFYENQLVSSPIHMNKIKPQLAPYLLFHCCDHLKKEKKNQYFNMDEVVFIRNVLIALMSKVDASCKYSVGIITPYTNQRDVIRSEIRTIQCSNNVKITVNTVDGFQGQENDITIISCVRSDANNFVQNQNRLNVALTRARQALYIVGNYALFDDCKLLYDLRQDSKQRKLCVDIKNLENNNLLPMLTKVLFSK